VKLIVNSQLTNDYYKQPAIQIGEYL